METKADSNRSALMRFVFSSIANLHDEIQVRLCREDQPYHHFSSHKGFKLVHGLIQAITTFNALADDLLVALNVQRQASVRRPHRSCRCAGHGAPVKVSQMGLGFNELDAARDSRRFPVPIDQVWCSCRTSEFLRVTRYLATA